MLLLVVTGFHSGRELLPHPVLLVVGFARMLAMYIIAMYIIPMITMRLFPVEAQDRTIESQVTSPVTEANILLGKLLVAFFL